MLVIGLFTVAVVATPYVCAISWLLRNNPDWAEAARQTGLLWIFGLVIQMIALIFASSRKLFLQDDSPKSRAAVTTVTALALILTAAALASSRVDLAGLVAFGITPLVPLGTSWSRAKGGSTLKIIANLVAAASLMAGFTEGVIMGGIGVLVFSYFKSKDFWKSVSLKPTRQGFLLAQHRVCSVGGG